MKFEKLYSESLDLWPSHIYVSDGKPSEDGILFESLSSIWDNVEAKAKSISEWAELIKSSYE